MRVWMYDTCMAIACHLAAQQIHVHVVPHNHSEDAIVRVGHGGGMCGRRRRRLDEQVIDTVCCSIGRIGTGPPAAVTTDNACITMR
jgi:hypothetical protein